MFARILVPLDGRDLSTVALGPARTLARVTRASIRLLTVLDEGASADQRSAAEAHQEVVAEGIAAGGVSVDTRLAEGSVAEQIVRGADADEADLIVMATHARSGLGRALLGSVAEQVVATSSIPVMLVRPGSQELDRVRTLLVPVDGSPGGLLALAAAATLAKAVGAKIVLYQSVVPTMAVQPGELWFVDDAWDDEAVAGAQRYVSGLADRLNAAGIEAEGRAELAAATLPAASVVERIRAAAAAANADLIVMSTHGYTGPRRALLGSVADAVMRAEHRPVLLVRREHPE